MRDHPENISTVTGSRPVRATSQKYRPDIDGLRAVAVLLVLFDHLRTRISGGYIGVDIFFVISGYLISSAIIAEIAQKRFSFVNFYERRARRILPALIVTIAGTTVLAYQFLVPAETASFARSVLAALFSVSNMYFLHGTGYFGAPAAFLPLLHTWSLSVEEQFYIFFPIFLVVIARWGWGRLRACIWIVFFISLILASLWIRRDASVAFYFAPLRAWELLTGRSFRKSIFPRSPESGSGTWPLWSVWP